MDGNNANAKRSNNADFEQNLMKMFHEEGNDLEDTNNVVR